MQRGMLRNDSQGGGAVRTAQALQIQTPVGQDALFKTIQRLGGDLIKDRLETERTVQYAAGMQKAAQGQALEEIVDEQPWYSKLFGSTSLVDGARAYSASNAAMAVATELEANMPELRKLSASEMARVAAEKIGSVKTGDDVADAMVIHQLGRELPSVLKAQAKAHLRYKQETLESAIGDNVTGAATRLRSVGSASRAGGATVDPADVVQAGQSFLAALTRPAEMSKEVHERLVTDRIARQVYAGNFDVFNALTDSGYIDSLPAEAQFTLRRAHNAASNEARGKMPLSFIEEQAAWAVLSSDPSTKPEAILAGREALQAKYTRVTGDRSEIISGSATVRELEQLRRTQDTYRKQLAAEAARQSAPDLKRAAEIAVYDHDIARMLNVAEPYFLTHLDAKDRQATLDHLAATQPTETRMAILARQADVGVFDKSLQTIINAGVNGAVRTNDPVMLSKVYQTQVLPLIVAGGDRGLAVAMSYMDKDAAEIMARYHKVAQGADITPENVGLIYSNAVLPQPAKMESKADLAIVAEVASGRTGRFFKAVGRGLGYDTYPVENATAVAGWLKPHLSDAVDDPADNVAQATKRAVNLSIVGGYGWLKSAKASRLDQYMLNLPADVGVPSNRINYAFRQHLDGVREANGLVGDIQVGQDADAADGSPRLYVVGTNSAGSVKIVSFTGSEIVDSYRKREAADEFDPTLGSPKLTITPDVEAPSIYDSPAKWQAYREAQARKQSK
jgi:hypothetical protein